MSQNAQLLVSNGLKEGDWLYINFVTSTITINRPSTPDCNLVDNRLKWSKDGIFNAMRYVCGSKEALIQEASILVATNKLKLGAPEEKSEGVVFILEK